MEKSESEEILEAIHLFSSRVDKQFAEVRDELREFIDQRVAKSEHAMKDFVDRRVGKLDDDLVSKVRGVDEKDSALLEILKEQKVLTDPDSQRIISLSPFASK